MQIKQFRYSTDNLAYLIYQNKSAVIIDGGAVDSIISFVNQNNLIIEFITNTHTHPDHTQGNTSLLKSLNGVFIDMDKLYETEFIQLGDEKLHVLHTPGHTKDSFCFHGGNFLVSGDTLFNGKAGRCFSGDLKGFLKSIKTLLELPLTTNIYAGHDYVEEYMGVAKQLMPDNGEIDKFLKKYNPDHVYSTLADEMKINPCLKFNDDKMISVLKGLNLPIKTEYDRWKSIMSVV